MSTFERHAVQITQGNLTFYLTYVTPSDLFDGSDFYTVDQLEPSTDDGFQRILDNPRANRLERHLRDSFREGYANIPTTIFLATDKSVEYDQSTSLIRFETDEVCPFSVVDGQHRIEGLKRALVKAPDSGLIDFKLPATIAVDLNHTHQMYHFYIVNTTQRPVQSDLSQQITSRFTKMAGVEELPYLPHWIDREVQRGTDAMALSLAESLNQCEESPLKDRIRMANDPNRRGNRINQSSVVTTFKNHVFADTNPVFQSERDPAKLRRIMLNYFCAIDALFVEDIDPDDTIVWRDNGLFFFTLISRWVFMAIYASSANFSVESIKETIGNALEFLDDDYQVIAHSEWWRRGARGGASGVNRAGWRLYANGFLYALNDSRSMDSQV